MQARRIAMTSRSRSLLVLAMVGMLVTAVTGTASAQAPTIRKYYIDGKQIPTPKQVPPVYPEKEHQRRIGGTVLVAFTYAADGKVTSATVKTSSGNKNLNAGAVAAVKQWIVETAAKDGGPTAGVSETSISFSP